MCQKRNFCLFQIQQGLQSMAVLHNMDLLLEQQRVFTVYLKNSAKNRRFESLAGSWRTDFYKSKTCKIPFLFKCWKDFCLLFCFIRISLSFLGNQKQTWQFVSHLAHVLESEGELVVTLSNPCTVQDGEFSTEETCQQLTLPNQTGISVDNRKIMWWKMDTQNEGRKVTSIICRSSVFPPGYKVSHPSEHSEDVAVSLKTHPQKVSGWSWNNAFFSYNFLSLGIWPWILCHCCVLSFTLVLGHPELPRGGRQSPAARSRGRGFSGSLSRCSPCQDPDRHCQPMARLGQVLWWKTWAQVQAQPGAWGSENWPGQVQGCVPQDELFFILIQISNFVF